MDSKSASIIVAVILIIIVIVLLIAYSYYPSSEYNTFTPVVDAKAAQAVASKRRKEDGVVGSPPRGSDGVWEKWAKLQLAGKSPEQQSTQ